MTQDEVTAILAIMKTAYPSFYKNMSNQDIDSAIDLWSMMFADDSAKIVTEAVKALMCTLKFPPTIADVKEKISLITKPKAMTEMEVWGKVLAAIQSSNYYSQENFDKLPPAAQKVIGSPNQLKEWAMMESEVINSVVQSNFMRSYKAKVAHEAELSRLPESTKQLMVGLSEKFKMIGT